MISSPMALFSFAMRSDVIRILFVSSEIYPLAKTGGLADVSHALPSALHDLGIDIGLLMPGYPQAIERAEGRQQAVALGSVLGFEAALIPTLLPGSTIPLWLLDCPELFAREGRLYSDINGHNWGDNYMRFALLSYTAARIANGLCGLGWQPDIVHANDWHTGLIPLLTKDRSQRPTPCLFTIHNMAYQGVFDTEICKDIGLDPAHIHRDGIEYYGRISYLKSGIHHADKITTVSPTYAREIMKAEFGLGLEGLLSSRSVDLTGILNGVDYRLWDPTNDPWLSAPYNANDLSGKRAAKAVLLETHGLTADDASPVFAYMSRLTEQKMADHILTIAPAIAERFGRFIVLAEGESRFEAGFKYLARRHPDRIAVQIGYKEPAAHRLLAGADILLSPARFEPCGLTQLYALRYGTIPIVCRTGGLADSIIDTTPETLAARRATGFHMADRTGEALLQAIARAMKHYHRPLTWRRLIETAMRQDFSWTRSARAYRALYEAMAPGKYAPHRHISNDIRHPKDVKRRA